MRMLFARFSGFLAFVLYSISNAPDGHGQGANTAAEPQYLVLQIFAAGPRPTPIGAEKQANFEAA